MEDIVNVCKRRGFVFQSSEIYNGFNGFYDYGPLGGKQSECARGRGRLCRQFNPISLVDDPLNHLHHQWS